MPQGAFTALVKGMRNPSKVSFEHVDQEEDGDDWRGDRWIKYLANTGQDTIEWIHAFDGYGLNFGFRPREGIFPTSFEIDVPADPGNVPSNDARCCLHAAASRLIPWSVYRRSRTTRTRRRTGTEREYGAASTGHSHSGRSWSSPTGSPSPRRRAGTDERAVNRNNLQEPRPVKPLSTWTHEVNFSRGAAGHFFLHDHPQPSGREALRRRIQGTGVHRQPGKRSWEAPISAAASEVVRSENHRGAARRLAAALAGGDHASSRLEAGWSRSQVAPRRQRVLPLAVRCIRLAKADQTRFRDQDGRRGPVVRRRAVPPAGLETTP